MMDQALAIGIDDFREVRAGDYYYIDKTLLIKDFIRYKNKVSLITRPRRFGKTLNVTMLREFFDITKDSKEIFKGLAIMDTEYATQLNTRPVIYLTFKNCSGRIIEEMYISLAKAIRAEYLRYESLFGDAVDQASNDYFAFYQIYNMLKEVREKEGGSGEKKSYKIDITLLKSGLTELMKSVSAFFDQNPIVLIDEYDQPLIKAHDMGFRESFSKGVYGSLLGDALKGNDYLGQALLTGIQRVAKESIFSEVNNFVVYTVVDDIYAPYFGLTERETSRALQCYGFELTDEIRNYYDGYIFGEVEIYNPWSILKYIHKNKLYPYWINTSTNALIRELISNADVDFMEGFEELIKDGEVEAYVNLEASFMELEAPETLWGLLVNSGYLTVAHELGEEAYILKIPNQEVKKEFRSIVATYAGFGENRVHQLFSALSNRNIGRFLKIYQKLVYDCVSYHDVNSVDANENDPHENSYHMLFLGMAISMSGMYKPKSNRESGDGRSDIIMRSLQPDLRPHIVFEFKQGEAVAELKQEALDQIFEKKYYVELHGNVLCVGIAHNKKKCELVHKEIVVDAYGDFVIGV